MARRPSQRDDAVTTEPVADFDAEDAFVGGTDLSTALCIFTCLFIVFGIGLIYWNLHTEYDISVDPSEHYPGYLYNEHGEKIGAGEAGGGGGSEEPAEAPADPGSEKPAEGGSDSGDDDGFGGG